MMLILVFSSLLCLRDLAVAALRACYLASKPSEDVVVFSNKLVPLLQWISTFSAQLYAEAVLFTPVAWFLLPIPFIFCVTV